MENKVKVVLEVETKLAPAALKAEIDGLLGGPFAKALILKKGIRILSSEVR